MGPAAHSFIWNGNKPVERFQHERDLKVYCENPLKFVEKTELTREQLVEERFLISLRTKKGISFEELRNRYGFELSDSQQNYLKSLEKQGLVMLNSEKLVLTKHGWLLSDRIALEVLCR
jgi:oxygen-independent coproporphyrinogen-3 oxidase